jgi:hypothetical protein
VTDPEQAEYAVLRVKAADGMVDVPFTREEWEMFWRGVDYEAAVALTLEGRLV